MGDTFVGGEQDYIINMEKEQSKALDMINKLTQYEHKYKEALDSLQVSEKGGSELEIIKHKLEEYDNVRNQLKRLKQTHETELKEQSTLYKSEKEQLGEANKRLKIKIEECNEQLRIGEEKHAQQIDEMNRLKASSDALASEHLTRYNSVSEELVFA